MSTPFRPNPATPRSSAPEPPDTEPPREFPAESFPLSPPRSPRRAFPCESAKRMTSGTPPGTGTTLFACTTAAMACSTVPKRISAPAVVVPEACSKRHSTIPPKRLKNSRSSRSDQRGGRPLTYTLSETTPTPF